VLFQSIICDAVFKSEPKMCTVTVINTSAWS